MSWSVWGEQERSKVRSWPLQHTTQGILWVTPIRPAKLSASCKSQQAITHISLYFHLLLFHHLPLYSGSPLRLQTPRPASKNSSGPVRNCLVDNVCREIGPKQKSVHLWTFNEPLMVAFEMHQYNYLNRNTYVKVVQRNSWKFNVVYQLSLWAV